MEPCQVNSPPVTKSATLSPDVMLLLISRNPGMAYVSSSTQKDLGYMYIQFIYKYFSILTCSTWGMWVNVAKGFGIHVPLFNHALFHFDQTEAPHCGKKKIHWMQHVIKYAKFIILIKICEPQNINSGF